MAEDLQPANFILTDYEREVLKEHGYVMGEIFNGGSCSLVYNADYFGKKVKDFPKDVPIRLASKVMETEGVPKDFVNKFLVRELDIISRVCHPHIIQTHSIVQVGSKILVFMRYAEYGNLCDYITKFGSLKEKKVRVWFRQLAVALEYLHLLHIVHRDIKCENILITANNNVKLCDFGFARFSVDNKGKEVYSSTYCGSVAYAPPELIKGVPYEPKMSDIWSLGIVLYVMLNGIMPFKTENIQNLWVAQNNKDYRFRGSIVSKVSIEAQKLVSQMLEPNWFERITIGEILSHEWVLADPKLAAYTHMEAEAREKAIAQVKLIRSKPIKKMIEMNKTKNSFQVISEETPTLPSFKILPREDEHEEETEINEILE